MRENLLAVIGWFAIVGGFTYLVHHFGWYNAWTEPWWGTPDILRWLFP